MAHQKNGNRKIVLASGVFDLLHLGHVKFLEEAKRAGGENAKLVVIIARDNTVEQIKGQKPIMPERQRRVLVESLKVVDLAVLGFENMAINEVVTKIQPDIIALGHDQDKMAQEVDIYLKTHNSIVQIVRIGKFEADALDSSSKIKQKIVEKFPNVP
ncbi:MAG: FAD synthase [Nitrososphaerota archaeon]|uniref:adenylyltransferase/cytidyltransferase family protein n=1 Tax=Candidatus Bathycorpusculum sp. TaxID=2994959 RepID=UPI00281FF7F2|nr:FAD synthase [Candidatus Termiticorpusculum sp.]MCL2257387.1 FAD synthase [Candidatus Termiticorpusculum sp.]MCL2292514.1 FAD synthase [Candidatus Termiticorpusculum sp.]MDR0460713.1 FAD synthase [Nitrososphaerota archaeon]